MTDYGEITKMALRGRNVVVIVKSFYVTKKRFVEYIEYLSKTSIPFEARYYDERVIFPNGSLVTFATKGEAHQRKTTGRIFDEVEL